MHSGLMVPLAAVIVSTMLFGAQRANDARGSRDELMRAAAEAFLDALSEEHRELATLRFDDANRLDWHYVPRERRGLALREMSGGERRAAHGLLRAALSSRGYLKTVSIMELDRVLREEAEARGARAAHRDPLLYWVTVFGDPSGEAAWGWRIEGHHLSLNFTSVTGEVAVTPAFLGADPAEVRGGRREGLRVLAQEEDLARALLGSLDEVQRAEAVIDEGVPRDIVLAPGMEVTTLGEPRGLAFDAMRAEQRAIVESLLAEWAGNLREDLAAAQMERIAGAGLGAVRFLRIGSGEPGRPHYYRLHGPTFVIEYDNTQDDANHVHTVWRDLERDFGADLLREHLHADHGHEE